MENIFTDVRVQRVKVRHLEKRMLQKKPFKLIPCALLIAFEKGVNTSIHAVSHLTKLFNE